MLFGLEDDEHASRGRRVSFSMEDNLKEHLRETLETDNISAVEAKSLINFKDNEPL